MKDTRKTFRMDNETHSYLKTIAKLSDRSMSSVLNELIGEIALVASGFRKGFKIWVDSSVAENCVTIRLVGEKLMVSGQFKAESEEEETSKLVEKLVKISAPVKPKPKKEVKK